jgi:hypothetical protein
MSDPFDFDPPPMPAPAYAPKAGGIAARARAAAGGPDYLQGLNAEQREAVEALDGPVLVLAGAGTGKTRVLTTRIAHILASGRARAHEILAVTFTNKAAREMKERVAQLAGPAGEGMPWLGTFHAISTKILRRHAELVGLKSGFTILDTDDQIRLLKQIIKAEDIDDKRWPARVLAFLIDGWKNRGLTPDKVPAGEAAGFANGKGGELYRHYQERLKILDAADFGDLMLESLRLFREHPDVLAQYHQRFKFILVDEYQDTNIVQYLWLRLLAQGANNLCCVGDDDQCLAEGASIMLADGATRPIETIAPGDQVLSAFGSGDVRAARVLRVHKSDRAGDMIRIRTRAGREIVSTPEHVHFAGYRLGLTPQTAFVYLMRKNGVGWRVGTTQVYTRGQKQPALGFMQRCLQEHADALWIVSTHASQNEARLEEMRLSLAYGLPQIPFVPRKGKGANGVVHDAGLIARLYAAIDTQKGAEALLRDVGLSPREPHSIYGWRGAEVDNILRFEHDFPGAAVVRLERNYRSTGHILAAASHLIAHNEGRLGKTLFTDDESGREAFRHRRVGFGGGSPPHRRRDRGAAQGPFARRDRHSRARLVPDARIRGPFRHHRRALSRHRRPALLRARRKSATPWPICASSTSRPTISPSSASTTRPSAAWATPRCNLHAYARAARVPLLEAARQLARDRGAEAEGAPDRARPDSRISPAGAPIWRRCRTPNWPR